MTLAYADVVGEKHVRMKLVGPDGTRLDAIAFRSVGTALGEGLLKARGSRVHVAGALRMDHWNGRARVQLLVEDATAGGGVRALKHPSWPGRADSVIRATQFLFERPRIGSPGRATRAPGDDDQRKTGFTAKSIAPNRRLQSALSAFIAPAFVRPSSIG